MTSCPATKRACHNQSCYASCVLQRASERAAMTAGELERDAVEASLARICKALGVQTDWHSEPFPHEAEVLAAIAAVKADAEWWKNEAAETRQQAAAALTAAEQQVAELREANERFDAENTALGQNIEGAVADLDAARAARQQAEQEKERLVAALGMDEPWAAPSVLRKLAEHAEHILRDHDCDHLGHELVRRAMIRATEVADAIESALTHASADGDTADLATSHPIELRYVRYDGASEDDLDEIVATNATVHLERMDDSTFMLTVHTANPGADLALWIGPKRAKCQAGLVCAAGNVRQKRPEAVPTEPQPAAPSAEVARG